MNEHLIVFAADSATTVSMWVRGDWKTRYFKGANKLFQLSRAHPVGLMVYGSASLHGVSWEILIKDFRSQLHDEACDRLAEYPKRLFDFIAAHSVLFPDEVKYLDFKNNVISIVLEKRRQILKSTEYKAAAEREES